MLRKIDPCLIDSAPEPKLALAETRGYPHRRSIYEIKVRFVAGTVLSLLFAAATLVAHHSNAAQFDSTKRVTLKGEVTKIEWTNPHAYIYINVKDAAGKVVNLLVGRIPAEHTASDRMVAEGSQARGHDYRSKAASHGTGRRSCLPARSLSQTA